MTLNRTLTLTLAGLSVLGTGCATKNHVRQEVAPVISKVNELDELTARTTNQIRDLDARAQQGIQGATAKAAEADQKAQTADTRAGEAQQLASTAATRAGLLQNRVLNFDNFRPVAETTILFGFNKDALTAKGKEALDQIAAEIPNTKGFLVEVEGAADPVGDPQYNYQLSQRRAASVIQYLAQKHDIPAHKIRVIGIGEDKQVEGSNAQNRRVDVRLMTNTLEEQNQQTLSLSR